jgi:hypothetical protein
MVFFLSSLFGAIKDLLFHSLIKASSMGIHDASESHLEAKIPEFSSKRRLPSSILKS